MEHYVLHAPMDINQVQIKQHVKLVLLEQQDKMEFVLHAHQVHIKTPPDRQHVKLANTPHIYREQPHVCRVILLGVLINPNALPRLAKWVVGLKVRIQTIFIAVQLVRIIILRGVMFKRSVISIFRVI
jgi:hypothetical protein